MSDLVRRRSSHLEGLTAEGRGLFKFIGLLRKSRDEGVSPE